MGSGTYLLGELSQSHSSPHSIQISDAFEFVRHGKQVKGHMLRNQSTHCLKYHTMLLAIETTYRKFIHSLIYAVRFDQKGSEDCLFNIKSLRRHISHLKP